MFKHVRLCRKDEISFDIVAKNGNNVEATFNIVEIIVKLVAFDNVASTLLLVWTGLNADLSVDCWTMHPYHCLQMSPRHVAAAY